MRLLKTVGRVEETQKQPFSRNFERGVALPAQGVSVVIKHGDTGKLPVGHGLGIRDLGDVEAEAGDVSGTDDHRQKRQAQAHGRPRIGNGDRGKLAFGAGLPPGLSQGFRDDAGTCQTLWLPSERRI